MPDGEIEDPPPYWKERSTLQVLMEKSLEANRKLSPDSCFGDFRPTVKQIHASWRFCRRTRPAIRASSSVGMMRMSMAEVSEEITGV